MFPAAASARRASSYSMRSRSMIFFAVASAWAYCRAARAHVLSALSAPRETADMPPAAPVKRPSAGPLQVIPDKPPAVLPSAEEACSSDSAASASWSAAASIPPGDPFGVSGKPPALTAHPA